MSFASHPTPPRPSPAALPLQRGDSAVVLIVDDVPDNLAVLHDALDESGYTVLVATHGEAALQAAAQAVPDVVVLDALMPGMDGFEVARRLKASAATAHIPIIFMTGLTDTEHLVAALAAGGIDYVTKPIKPREVLARMGVHLGAARKARQVLCNTEMVLGIELMCAAQALEFLRPLRPGRGVEKAYRQVRGRIAPLEGDRMLAPDIAAAAEMVRAGVFALPR